MRQDRWLLLACSKSRYLQGLVYDARPGILKSNLEIAQQLYERALALDRNFALAHAALSVPAAGNPPGGT